MIGSGMEPVVFIILIVLLIPILMLVLLFKIRGRQKSQDERLDRIEHNQKQILKEIRENISAGTTGKSVPVNEKPVVAAPAPAAEKPVVTPAAPIVKPPEIPPVTAAAPIPPVQSTPAMKPQPAQPAMAGQTMIQVPQVAATKPQGATAAIPKPAVQPSVQTAARPPAADKVPEFPVLPASEFEQKTLEILSKIWSWIIVGEGHRIKSVTAEYAIATTWLVRLGVIIFLCGSAFFLKYSIEHGLLPNSARVALCVAAAIAMLGFGMKITGAAKQFDLIGRGLLGGGIVLLYFSVHSAANLYQLLAIPPAFGFMVLITAVAFAISVHKDSLLVAVLGIIGGTITPVILNTGVKNFPGLFGYMLLLALGALAISRYRNWKLLNLLSFIATWGIYLLALNRDYIPADYTIATIFLCVYFVVFFIQSIIFNIRNREPVTTFELLIILANTVLLFYKGWEMTLAQFPRPYGAFFSLGAAAFFIVFIIYFLHRKYRDRNLLLMLFALTAFSITVTFPLLLSGKWITFSWSALAVVFLWLGLRLGSRFLSNCSFLIYFLALMRILTVDGSFHSTTFDYVSGMTDRLITIGSVIAALAAGRFLMNKYAKKDRDCVIPEDNDVQFGLPSDMISGVLLWGGAMLLVSYFTLEALRVSEMFYLPMREPAVMLVWAAATAMLARFAGKFKSAALLTLTIIAGVVLLVKLLVDIDVWHFNPERFAYCCDPLWDYTFMRAIEFIALIVLAFFCMNRLRFRQDVKLNSIMGAVAIGLLFAYLTLETSTLLLHYVPEFRAGGVSILWAAFAFTLIFRGLRQDSRNLRYAGLLLFSVDVFKIFMVDLSHLAQLYRIVAFIVLGIVMVGSAFIYMKFREQFKTENKDAAETEKSASAADKQAQG